VGKRIIAALNLSGVIKILIFESLAKVMVKSGINDIGSVPSPWRGISANLRII